jgi:hypothetical protein
MEDAKISIAITARLANHHQLLEKVVPSLDLSLAVSRTWPKRKARMVRGQTSGCIGDEDISSCDECCCIFDKS